MLVLSRKVGESIVIGDDVQVTIVSIRGNKIRIGIKAPNDVNVYREELTAAFEDHADCEGLAMELVCA